MNIHSDQCIKCTVSEVLSSAGEELARRMQVTVGYDFRSILMRAECSRPGEFFYVDLKALRCDYSYDHYQVAVGVVMMALHDLSAVAVDGENSKFTFVKLH